MSSEESTYVQDDGLAVVHRGERIVAAPGSEAQLAPSPEAEIHYHFPVHLVVLGDIGEQARADIRADLLDELYRALG